MSLLDLSKLGAPRKFDWEPLRVYNKATNEVILIKSTRFNNKLHSLQIPKGAKWNIRTTHPDKAIELKLSNFEENEVKNSLK